MSFRRSSQRPPARGILRRAIEILKQEGLLTLWYRILGETVYRRMLVMERSLDEPVPVVEARCAADMHWLRAEESAACARFYGVLSEAEVIRRLQEGHRCLVAEANGQILHARWVAASKAWIAYLKLDFPLAPGQAYMYQAYTAPEIQGRHLASAAMATVLRRLQEEGFQRAFCCLQPDRTVSYSPPLRNGFLPMNWLGWVRLGPWRRVFRRPVRRLPACARRALGVGSRYWDVLFRWRARRSSHLDRFLGGLKRRAHLRLIRRWGGIPRAGRVLKTDLFEEADGTGRYLEVLRQAGTAVVGMDISSAICEHASRSSGAAPCGYAAADVRQLPFADGAFALVISPSTLDHFTKPEDLGVSLRELWRVLGEGGRLIVTLDNRHNVFDPLLRLAGRLGLAPYILGRSYSLREVVAELKAAGFAIVDTAAILHGPRLVPVLSVALARKLGWRWLRRRVHRMLLRAQALEGTRWKYWTASLLAALAEVRK